MDKALFGFVLGVVAGIAAAMAQTPDPAYLPLDHAYAALKAKNYDDAIRSFEQAAALAPARPSIRKDLAYTLLKIGESERAREQFAEALRLDPADDQIALEYAFLCYETRQPVIARRVFSRLSAAGNPMATEAFENVDRPLREGIARWQQALDLAPDNFSAHEELARLAEQRDELDLAAAQYTAAWKLRPARRDLLLDLGRMWQQQGRAEESLAAMLAVSRGAEPTTLCGASWRICIWKWAIRSPPRSSSSACRIARSPPQLPRELRILRAITSCWVSKASTRAISTTRSSICTPRTKTTPWILR
jgi:Tfp pilus assembly protein PilF